MAHKEKMRTRGNRSAACSLRPAPTPGPLHSLHLVPRRRPDVDIVEALKLAMVHQRRLDAGGPGALRLGGSGAGRG